MRLTALYLATVLCLPAAAQVRQVPSDSVAERPIPRRVHCPRAVPSDCVQETPIARRVGSKGTATPPALWGLVEGVGLDRISIDVFLALFRAY